MSKWQPKQATIFDIMCGTDIENNLGAARQLWHQGIDKENEWAYCCDSFKWVDENSIHTEKDNVVYLSNHRTLLKISKPSAQCPTPQSSQEREFEALWTEITGRCTETNRRQLTGNDGAIIKAVMAKPWAWHIQFVFERLGYYLKEEETISPFGNHEKLPVASPRETAEMFGYEFDDETRQKEKVITIGSTDFSILMLWISLKLINAEGAKKRNVGFYQYQFEDGTTQSYLKITADANECYVGSRIKEK